MAKSERTNSEKIKDRIIEFVLIIIIIILLLHNCSLSVAKKDPTGNVNIISITCDDGKCDNQEKVIDCLSDKSNNKCVVPNFVGKTKQDVLDWLNSISNSIDIEYRLKESNEKEGIILEQSLVGVSVKELLDGKNKLVITISGKGALVDCLSDDSNSKCVIPNFVGKTKNDVVDWLNNISNNVKVKYVYRSSNTNSGLIISQSLNSGKSLKEMLEKGEVLVIYISIGNKSGQTTNAQSNNGSSNNYNSTEDSGSGEGNNDEDDVVEPENEMFVRDNRLVWNETSPLKIFTNSVYNFEEKIAPESSNTYQFVVKNSTSYQLKYTMSFIETNPYHINMKYKLKKNDTYIVDHYVSYNELNINEQLLSAKTNDTFYLEWKWVSSDNDNEAGEHAADYSLSIKVEAESI